MEVKKETLLDYSVCDDSGKTLAWIKKVKAGYNVTFRCETFNSFENQPVYFWNKFTEAKKFALDYI